MTKQQLFIGRVHVGFKIERDGIHTITLVGWWWTIIEDMPEMRIAATACYLGAYHAVSFIEYILRSTLTNVFEEARPATTTVKLGVGSEQWISANRTVVSSDYIVFVILSCECALSMRFASYEVKLAWQNVRPFVVAYIQMRGIYSRIMGVIHSV